MSTPLAVFAALVLGATPLDPQSAAVPVEKALSSQEVIFGSLGWYMPAETEQSRRSRDPYENLFDTAPRVPQLFVQAADQAAAPEPIIKCGIIMVPADPSVDPGIVVRLPDHNVDFKIRRIVPERCES